MNRSRFAMFGALSVLLASPATARAQLDDGSCCREDTIMTGVGSFRSEHGVLLDAFRARLQPAVAPTASRGDRAGLVLFVRAYVLPHARAEEQVLYPEIEGLLGTHGQATAAMVREHGEIAGLTDELRDLAGGDPAAFGRKALALETLLDRHFGTEEAFLVPIFQDRLSAAELHALFDRMSRQTMH